MIGDETRREVASELRALDVSDIEVDGRIIDSPKYVGLLLMRMLEAVCDYRYGLHYFPAFFSAQAVLELFADLIDHKMVELPKDADGREIPLDTRVLYSEDGVLRNVRFFCYHVGCTEGCKWVVAFENGVERLTSQMHITPSDSWEKLEEDIQKVAETDDTCAYFGNQGKSCDGCPAVDIPDLCLVVILRDVLRRAKALAECDAKKAKMEGTR